MKNLLLILSFVLSFGTIAQEFRGVVTYQSKNTLTKIDLNNKNMAGVNDQMKKAIVDELKKASEKTYTLYFDSKTSLYEEVETIKAGNDNVITIGFDMATKMMNGGKLYKNLSEDYFLQERDLLGTEFLVKDQIIKLEWELSSETKLIGEYVCYKATAKNTFDVDFSDIANNKESTGFLSRMTENSNKNNLITAWYTPQIPIANGPSLLGGLPGLILEVNDGKNIILCSELVINPKKTKQIKTPKKGKIVTLEEYNKLLKETLEELQKTTSSK